ncbi:hypothetical protein GPU89_02590 [Burkholderia cepacia]|nr:hypothetical protein [Burkholderia cepacia]
MECLVFDFWRSAFLLGATVLADQRNADPFVAFQQRFGGNQEFVCTAKGGKKLSVNVGVPQADADQMKVVPRQEWGNTLSVYLSAGEGSRLIRHGERRPSINR